MKNTEHRLWKFISDSLTSAHNCVLLVVTHHKGSSPGRVGFKMAINSKSKTVGSVGGGIMEHKVVELSKKWLQEDSKKVRFIHQVHRADASKDRSGMICSGEQHIAMVSLPKESLGLANSILKVLYNQSTGSLKLSKKGAELSLKPMLIDKSFDYSTDHDWYYQEELNECYLLHIVGGGHISLALSKLANDLGFRVTVYDERENLPTLQENCFAHEIKLTEYTNLAQMIPPGPKTYVVIMTVGYRTDMIALKEIIHESYGYIGLLGSKAKNRQMFQELKNQGFSEGLFEKINAPAGMVIGSQTPTEIAVSIAGRLIQCRRRTSD